MTISKEGSEEKMPKAKTPICPRLRGKQALPSGGKRDQEMELVGLRYRESDDEDNDEDDDFEDIRT